MKFLVKLPFFEGPFALLLFFVEKQEIDIHKISIAAITSDFLSYIKRANALNMVLAGDFILVAAKLMRIKANGLLPPSHQAEIPEEETKEHLIASLKAYKKYKQIAHALEDMQDKRARMMERGNRIQALADLLAIHRTDLEMEKITPQHLLNTYLRVRNRRKEQVLTKTYATHTHPYTVAEQKNYITKWLHCKKKLHFQALVAKKKGRSFIVHNLLAALDLAHAKEINLYNGEGFNNFWMTLRKPTHTPS